MNKVVLRSQIGRISSLLVLDNWEEHKSEIKQFFTDSIEFLDVSDIEELKVGGVL
jgi:hypothetical protein